MHPPADYREYPAGAALHSAVECFWTSTQAAGSGEPVTHRVLPDGCMDLLFDFVAVDGLRASVVGTMDRALTFSTVGPTDLLGVRFRPGGLTGMLVLDAAELTNESVGLANFWGWGAEQLWQKLAETPPEKRVSVLRETLVRRAHGRIQTDPIIYYCVRQLEATSGGLRVGELERATGFSSRQIERKFAQQIGLSPKGLARVIRFKRVVATADGSESVNWARFAADLGFADQAHLVRDFKSFAGLTLTEYRAEVRAEDVGFLQDCQAGYR